MSFQVFQAQGLRIYAGPSEAVNNYVGLPNELAINSDTKSVRILDGVTPGGVPLTTTSGAELQGLNIEQLANLLVTAPQNGEALVYQDGKWTNQPVAASGGASHVNDLVDVKLTNLQSGEVLSYNASITKWENKAVAAADHNHDAKYQAKGNYLTTTSNLGEINNVQITMPADGQSLVYDEGYQKWINTTVAGGSGGSGGGFSGAVIQVQHNPFPTNVVSTSQSWVDAQTVTFSPKSATSKILVMVNYGIGGKGAVCLLRNGTPISSKTSGANSYMFWQNFNQDHSDASSERQTMSMVIEDQPNTTGVVTYKTQLMGYEQNGICINPTPFREGNGVFSGMTIWEFDETSAVPTEITDPANGETLVYEDGKWVNSMLAGGSGVPAETSPIGMIAPFAMETAPDEWLVCDGSTLNSVANPEYADLFAAIGTTWGGTGASDFKVPDLKGTFLRGSGSQTFDGKTFDGGNVSQLSKDVIEAHTHTIKAISQAGSTYDNAVAGGSVSGSWTTNAQTQSAGDHETKPFSATVLYCIKYKAASGSAVEVSKDGQLYKTCGYKPPNSTANLTLDKSSVFTVMADGRHNTDSFYMKNLQFVIDSKDGTIIKKTDVWEAALDESYDPSTGILSISFSDDTECMRVNVFYGDLVVN